MACADTGRHRRGNIEGTDICRAAIKEGKASFGTIDVNRGK